MRSLDPRGVSHNLLIIIPLFFISSSIWVEPNGNFFYDFMHGPLYLTVFGLHFTGSGNGIPNTGDREIPFSFFSGVNFRVILRKRIRDRGVGSCLQHHYGMAMHCRWACKHQTNTKRGVLILFSFYRSGVLTDSGKREEVIRYPGSQRFCEQLTALGRRYPGICTKYFGRSLLSLYSVNFTYYHGRI